MPKHSSQPFLPGPAPVSIHDNGYVTWYSLFVNLIEFTHYSLPQSENAGHHEDTKVYDMPITANRYVSFFSKSHRWIPAGSAGTLVRRRSEKEFASGSPLKAAVPGYYPLTSSR